MRGHTLVRALRKLSVCRDAHSSNSQTSHQAEQNNSFSGLVKQHRDRWWTLRTRHRAETREEEHKEQHDDKTPKPLGAVDQRRNEDRHEAHPGPENNILLNVASGTKTRAGIYVVSEEICTQVLNSDSYFPLHPISALQGAFEESATDAAEGTSMSFAPCPPIDDAAETRRKDLMEQHSFEESWVIRWKQRSYAKYHPLLKAVAQITYGLHLLHHEQAESEPAVVEILQGYVNVVDGFLERTDKDFQLALRDTKAQTGYLRLLMQYPDVFAKLLCDKDFRSQLVTGNDRLEKLIQRTLQAVNVTMYDHEECVFATNELDGYLLKVKDDWPQERSLQVTTFVAMLGNKDGWLHYLLEVQRQGRRLCVALIQLRMLMEDMSKMIAVASRRNTITELDSLLNKPLPREPDSHESVYVATVPEIQSRVISESLERVYKNFKASTDDSSKAAYCRHRGLLKESFTKASRSPGQRHDSMFF